MNKSKPKSLFPIKQNEETYKNDDGEAISGSFC